MRTILYFQNDDFSIMHIPQSPKIDVLKNHKNKKGDDGRNNIFFCEGV